jgi:hypothetical protein
MATFFVPRAQPHDGGRWAVQLSPPSRLSRMPLEPGVMAQSLCGLSRMWRKSDASTASVVMSCAPAPPTSAAMRRKPAGFTQVAPPSRETQKPMVTPPTPCVA